MLDKADRISLQVPDKVKKLVLGWLSHIVFLHFSNEVGHLYHIFMTNAIIMITNKVEQPDQQTVNKQRKQSKVSCVTNLLQKYLLR